MITLELLLFALVAATVFLGWCLWRVARAIERKNTHFILELDGKVLYDSGVHELRKARRAGGPLAFGEIR